MLKLVNNHVFTGAWTYLRFSNIPLHLKDGDSLSLPVTCNYLLQSGAIPSDREADVNPALC